VWRRVCGVVESLVISLLSAPVKAVSNRLIFCQRRDKNLLVLGHPVLYYGCWEM